MLYRWCFSCGHQSVEALWLEFREITFYHYNLSISSEMAVHLCNECCFSKWSSCCAFTRVVIRIHRLLQTDYIQLVICFFMNLCRKKQKRRSYCIVIFFILTFPTRIRFSREILTSCMNLSIYRICIHLRFDAAHVQHCTRVSFQRFEPKPSDKEKRDPLSAASSLSSHCGQLRHS